MAEQLASFDFYSEYHGHRIPHLETVHAHLLEERGERFFMYLLGDSSLDNKHWIAKTVGAVNGYERVLHPPTSRPDVAYHLNAIPAAAERSITINAAIEESRVGQRVGWFRTELMPQDVFVRDRLTPDDVLVVSVGGNDIALAPTPATIWNMLWLLRMNTTETLKYALEHGVNWASPRFWCASHFVGLFRDKIASYLRNVTEKTKPRLIVVGMIYFPDEKATGSWADRTLAALGYGADPEKLQTLIRIIYREATSKIRIRGTTVVPVAFFDVMDGKDTRQYVDRVEPSDSGGQAMAGLIWRAVQENYATGSS
mmetsp:Transcript_4893/g.16416  ORF Transcript_4893/g.16416 Transcript_4893/m.16416 type:complete len:312 (+) Transcript_4893:127-1062(+)